MVSKFPFTYYVVIHTCFTPGVSDMQKCQTAIFIFLRDFINRFPCLLPKDVSGDAVPAVSDHSVLPKRVDKAWTELGPVDSMGKTAFFCIVYCFDGDYGYFTSNVDQASFKCNL